MTSKAIPAVLLLCLALGGCDEAVRPGAEAGPPSLTDAELQLVAADNGFGLKLFREISDTEGDVNVFISPLSVSMALGMTYNGAAGGTEIAMRDVLELGDLTNEEVNESYEDLIRTLTGLDPNVEFAIANSIWCRQGVEFKNSFLSVNRAYFGAEVTGLDFSSPDAPTIINAWVKENTRGRIEKIVDDPIDWNTVIFLINAVYFKGAWTYQFDPDKTRDATFTLPDGSDSPCRMMTMEDTLRYQRTAQFQAVDLPYGDGHFSMVIILPASGTGLDGLVGMLSSETWKAWLEGFRDRNIVLQMPKYTLEYEAGLKDILSSLGMGVAFDPVSADFTRLYDGPQNLYISKVKHKTFVQVDEEGTEAAAVTSVEGTWMSGPPFMRVNHPFLFAIRERSSGAIIFIGKIVQPALQ